MKGDTIRKCAIYMGRKRGNIQQAVPGPIKQIRVNTNTLLGQVYVQQRRKWGVFSKMNETER